MGVNSYSVGFNATILQHRDVFSEIESAGRVREYAAIDASTLSHRGVLPEELKDRDYNNKAVKIKTLLCK